MRIKRDMKRRRGEEEKRGFISFSPRPLFPFSSEPRIIP